MTLTSRQTEAARIPLPGRQGAPNLLRKYSGWLQLGCAALLLLLWWGLSGYHPLREQGENLLADSEAEVFISDERISFDKAPRSEMDGFSAPAFRLGADDFVRYRLNGPFPHAHLVVESVLQAQELQRGERIWEDGRLALIGVADSGERLYDRDTAVCAAVGTQGPRHCRGVFEIHPQAKSVILVAVHRGQGGTLWVEPPTLRYASADPALPWVQGGIGLLWLLSGGLAAHMLGRAKTGRLVLLLGAVVVVNAALPMERFKPMLGQVRDGLMQAGEGIQRQLPRSPAGQSVVGESSTPQDMGDTVSEPTMADSTGEWLTVNRLQKWGHYLSFALLGALAAFRWRRYAPATSRGRWTYATLSGGWLLLFAAATEVTQMAIISRSGSLDDLSIDLSGVVGGVVIGLAGYRLSSWLGREGRAS